MCQVLGPESHESSISIINDYNVNIRFSCPVYRPSSCDTLHAAPQTSEKVLINKLNKLAIFKTLFTTL